MDATILSARKLGWNLTVTMHKCNSCCVSNSKQKDLPKLSNHVPDDNPSTRFFLDLSKMMKPSELKSMGKINWLIIVDEIQTLKFSSFHLMKGAMLEPACKLLLKFKNQGHPVEAIRCDNAGEKKC